MLNTKNISNHYKSVEGPSNYQHESNKYSLISLNNMLGGDHTASPKYDIKAHHMLNNQKVS